MSAATPIKPANPTKAIEERAARIRESVFQAQAIAEVAAAAARSEVPAPEWSTHKALKVVSKILDDAAEKLEPERLIHDMPQRLIRDT